MPITDLTQLEELKNNKREEEKTIVPLFDSDRADELMLPNLSGYNWDVTYFHREVDDYTTVDEFDPELDITLQNYTRIENFRLILESPIPTGIPDNFAAEAIVDCDFTPTPNDLFLTKELDGRIFLYVVKEVDRVTYNNEKLFKISFSIYAEIDDVNDPLLQTLLKSVTQTLYYNPEYRLTSTKPLYTEDELNIQKEFSGYKVKLLSYYKDTFFNNLERTLLIPVKNDLDNYLIYDSYLVNFIDKLVGISVFDNDIFIPNLELKGKSILDYLLRLDNDTTFIERYLNLKTPMNFTYSIDVYPLIGLGCDYIVDLSGFPVDSLNNEIFKSYLYDLDTSIKTLFTPIDRSNYIFRDVIYTVLFGETIDTLTTNLSLMDKIILNIITKNTIEKDDVVKLYKNIIYLPLLEQAYYIPILIYIFDYYLKMYTIPFI